MAAVVGCASCGRGESSRAIRENDIMISRESWELPEKIIKSKERVRKFAEVYTPEWIVKEMCDQLEKENEDAFSKIDHSFLEPSCGNGNFLVEILERKLLYCESYFDGLTALRSIYGIDILPDNIEESKQRMRDLFFRKFCILSYEVDEILDRNIVCGNFLTKETIDGKKIWFLTDGK